MSRSNTYLFSASTNGFFVDLLGFFFVPTGESVVVVIVLASVSVSSSSSPSSSTSSSSSVVVVVVDVVVCSLTLLLLPLDLPLDFADFLVVVSQLGSTVVVDDFSEELVLREEFFSPLVLADVLELLGSISSYSSSPLPPADSAK